MKKIFRILTITAVLTAVVLIAACKQFLADPEEFFSYWSSELVPVDYSIDKPSQTIGGVPCVPSANDVTVTVKLKNPKNIKLVTPASSSDAGRVIRFPGLSTQPTYGTYYTLVQTANDKLELTYKPLFLKDYEWCTKDIGADITFVSTDGRPFNKKFYLKLKVNTPPPKPTAVLAQTNSASPTYVLCLEVPDMGVSVTGGKLHKDIAQIEINGTPYELTLNGTTTDFVKPADTHFITAVTQLAGYPVPPSGNWVLYYDTQLPVGNAYRAYTVKLKDNKGLVSAVLETGTARPQLPAETVNITRGQRSTGSGLGGTTGDPIIINGETSAPEAQITIQNIAGTTVHCEVQEIVGASSTGAVSQYDTNPVTATLGLNGTNEKLYKVKYHTDGTGYTPTSTTIKYYKVLKCHSVTFNANGGTFLSGSTLSVLVPHGTVAAAPSTPPTKTGYHVDGWYTEAACTTQWNFSTQTITGDKQLYAKWAPNSGTSYRVEHYQELSAAPAGQYPASPTETENPTGTTGANITGIYKNYQGFEFDRQAPESATIAADGSTVVKVYYKRKTVNVTFNPNDGTIDSSTANVTLSGRFGTALTAPANLVKTGYTFSGWSPLLSTPPVFPANDTTYMAQWHKNPKVKFKVYNGTGGSLKGTYGSSTQTAGNVPPAILEPSFTVTYGGSISFEALPALAWEVDSWTGLTASPANAATVTFSNITRDTEVIVKFKKTTTIKSTDPQPWKLLKEVVRIADNNAVITINGEIKATNEGSAGVDANWGEIEINKNLTIKKADGATTAVLNANSNHATAPADAPADAPATPHRIFKVTGNKKLTLQNLTLKDGKDEGTLGVIGQGGAITVSDSDGKAELTNCIIEDCQAKYGGAIGCYSGTTVTLTNTTIQKCKATERGGAIFAEGATVNITSCTLKGNEAKVYGGAIFAQNSGSTPTIVTVSGGTIGGTNAADANKTTGTEINEGMGGGIYMAPRCTLNMLNNVQVIGNTARNGGGVYAFGTTVTLTNCTLKGNTAKSGGAIYAKKSGSNVSTVTITGGTIGGTNPADANKATGTGTDNGMGGGIWVDDTCSLNLKDSTDPSSGVQRLRILGNRAQKGTGIYAKNTIVSMKDTLQIDTNNDVYLDDGTKIRADNDLNPPSGFVARITVPDNKYNTSTQVLIANYGVNLANQTGKFTVTRGGSPAKNWYVGSNGNLTDDPAAIFDTISNDRIKAFESNLKTTTVAQYNNLKGRLIFYKTDNGNYGVMLITDTPPIGADAYNLKFKYKTYNKHDGTILKSGDTTVKGTFDFDLDTGTESTSAAPLNDTKDFFLHNSKDIDPQNGAKFYVLP